LENFTGNLEGSVLIMRPDLAARLSSTDRPNIGANGGEWAGIKVITSSSVQVGIIALIDPQGIAVTLPLSESGYRISTEASIEMSDLPTQRVGVAPSADSPTTDDAPVSTSTVSLWQCGSVAVQLEMSMNWRRIRTGNVVYVSGMSF
jgi:hypothetical protein